MNCGTIHPSHVAERDLREAAVLTLDAVPGAEAVLLFGSRARGGALPESDWDIAVITQGDDVRARRLGPTPIEALHPSVNAIFLGANLLREKRNSPGHIAREVLRDGRLLAGRMPRVGRIRRNPPMEKHEFIRKSGAAKGAIYRAGQAFVDALAGSPIQTLEEDAQSFVQCSADAAEHLAKLMIFRRGLTPPRLHDLNRLAEFLESSDPDGRWENTAAAVRAMDGRTREHHMAAYSVVDAEDVSHAIACLQRVCEAFIDECAEAGNVPELRAAVERQYASLRQRSAIIAGSLAAAEPVAVESEAVMTRRLAVDYGNEMVAREAAAEAWRAREAMRESLPVLRDLYERLARAELPR